MWRHLHKILAFVIFFFVIIVVCPARSGHPRRGLNRHVKSVSADTSQISQLLKSGNLYLSRPGNDDRNTDSALSVLRQAYRLSDSLKLIYYWHESLCLLGSAQLRKGDLKNGRAAFMRVIRNYQNTGDKAGEAQTWFRFGQGFMSIKAHFSPQLANEANFLEMMTCFKTALSIAKQISDKDKESGILIQMADFNALQQGNLKLAENEYLQALALQKTGRAAMVKDVYSGLMAVNYFRGNFNKALYYGMEAVKNAEGRQGDYNLDVVHFYFGNIYRDMGDYDKSLLNYQKSLAVVERKGEFEYLYSAIVRNTVRVSIMQGKGQKALVFLKDQVKKHPPEYPINKAIIAESFGHCYNALKQQALAEQYFVEMAEWSKKIGEIRAVYQHYAIAKFYFDIRRYEKADYYFALVLGAAPGIVPVSVLQRAHLMRFKMDSAAGNYVDAIGHFHKHASLKDSVFNETKSRQIEELQIKYETEKKERDIKLLINQGQLQSTALARNIIIAGVIILLLIMGMGYNRYRTKRHSHNKLQAQQEVINQKNISLENLISEQSKLLKEKEWLLKEIHHRVKNNLQIVMSLLNTQSVFIDNEAALKAIRLSQHRMYSMSLIHQKLYESKSVAKVEMPAYITELVEYLRDSYDTSEIILFNLDVDFIELDVSQAVPVGLILNEAITNSIKSAFPDGRRGLVKIAMKQTPDQMISLTVSDNGVGLPPDFKVERSNSLGMSLMEGLSRQLRGTFKIESSSGLTIVMSFKAGGIVGFDSKSLADEKVEGAIT
ncbi:tetratricopeptide repeat-containing sensor histidine kinase [Dyadobacter diqingensis]|uniref:tetratricopeptide repeat-containing sensor histidine kinase n=1 Tax=Dyadobacter diqingensis TaxID=2938121 RepID=UPI0020C19B8A|nr:histidine kinase dimerization/phosphoacceptor domain -containing protein [Dyadobacter diqingensis]